MDINRIDDFPSNFSKNTPQNGRFLGVYVRRRWTTANVDLCAYVLNYVWSVTVLFISQNLP